MTKTNSTNVSQLIKGLNDAGRNYTNARNAVVAHVILTGTKASVLVAETGLSKGDVSTIVSNAKKLPAAKQTAIKRLSVDGMVVSDMTTLADAIKLGALIVRKRATATAPDADTDKGDSEESAPVAKTGKELNDDAVNSVTEWLANADSIKQFNARVAIINNIIATRKAELTVAA